MIAPDSLLESILADPDRRHDLVLRYLRNQLQDPLLQALEVRLMDDPRLLAEIEEEQMLLDGIREWAAGELENRRAGSPAEDQLGGMRAPKWRLRAPVFAAAAATILAMLPVAWWLGAQRADPVGEVAAFHMLTAQRGAGAETSPQLLSVPPAAGRIVLRLPAPNRPGTQRLELWRDGEVQPRARMDVQPDPDGAVTLDFVRARLPAGRYQVRWPGAGETEAMAFELQDG